MSEFEQIYEIVLFQKEEYSHILEVKYSKGTVNKVSIHIISLFTHGPTLLWESEYNTSLLCNVFFINIMKNRWKITICVHCMITYCISNHERLYSYLILLLLYIMLNL